MKVRYERCCRVSNVTGSSTPIVNNNLGKPRTCRYQMAKEEDHNNRHRYWIIVASKDHVMLGVREGIAQANHGKLTPLRRMKKDDYIIYYSPKTIYGQDEKCQRFTAIGRIKDSDIFQVKLNETFSPFRSVPLAFSLSDYVDEVFNGKHSKWGDPGLVTV